MITLVLCLVLAAPGPVDDAEAQARTALGKKSIGEALGHYETAMRLAEDTPTKSRLREAYLAAGWHEPRPVSAGEERQIAAHIRNEKVRVFSKAAGDFESADKLHAAIILRRALIELQGGPESQGAKPHTERIKRIVRKLTENPSDEQKEMIAQILRAKKLGKNLIKAGRKLLEQREYRMVVRLCQEMMFGKFDQDIQNEALALRKAAEEAAANDVTPAQKKAALDVLTDKRFERIDIARSRHFLYIGPKTFVDRLTTKDRTMLDLAYIFQSDLAGRHLTSDGVRICIYYQETFDFGGGLALAGGKYIRIGNRAIRAPIAGMLHYHELGHCIFGKGWLHDGFTEGLADFAAGFTLDLLGQTSNARNFINAAKDQFVRYFLGRDVRYFHIQSYRPSAGFLFSFLPPGEAPYDWAPYRRVFHRMRDAQFAAWPSREHQLMRYFGYLMATEYGPDALAQLREWGWPVGRGDFTRVRAEARGPFTDLKRGNFLVERGAYADGAELLRGVLALDPHGPLAARARFGLMRAALAAGDADAAARLKRELGIVDRYLVCGPFHARRQTAYVVLPPETRIDLAAKTVRYGNETGTWKEAKMRADGYVDLRRDQGYGYPENACAFALAYVRVEKRTPARIWLGSDDGHTLYVNHVLAEKQPTGRRFRFDDDFADVTLEAGWNRVLVKVHNGNGEWGFLLRIAGRDRRAIPGLVISIDDHEADVAPATEPKTKSVSIVSDEFKGGLRTSRWVATVGKFDTRNGRLLPKGTQKFGLWYRFKVDPDKPKDGPANIVWLRSQDLARADNLALELVVAAGRNDGLPAKFGITIDGENENDGQSGHTFVFDANDEKLRCHWYRYDHLYFLQPGVKVEPAATYKLRLVRIGRKWRMTVNDVPVFDNVDAPRLPHLGFGILTWGAGPEFESVKLSRLEPVR